MKHDEIRQDEHELTGLIYFNDCPVWTTLIKHFLIFDSISFARDTADAFDILVAEAIAKNDERSAMDMTMVAEQLRNWAETREAVSWTIPYFGLRQLVRPYVVTREDIAAYIPCVLILAKVPGVPTLPEFVLLVGETPALYVTAKDDLLLKHASDIETGVLSQASLNKICGDLMR